MFSRYVRSAIKFRALPRRLIGNSTRIPTSVNSRRMYNSTNKHTENRKSFLRCDENLYHGQIDEHLYAIKLLTEKGHRPRDGIKFVIKSEHLETSFVTKPTYNEIREKTKLVIRGECITLEPKVGVTKEDIVNMWDDHDKSYIGEQKIRNRYLDYKDLDDRDIPLL